MGCRLYSFREIFPVLASPRNYVVDTNTLSVFVKQKYARLGLLSILTRRGKTVFTPSSPFSGTALYAPSADSKPQRAIPFLGELRPDLARQAGVDVRTRVHPPPTICYHLIF